MNSNFKRYLSEVVGTFLLMFCGAGAVVTNELFGGAVTHLGIAIVFGLIVLAVVYAFGEISGAHINPAVTVGFWVSGRFPGKDVAPYAISQVLGSVAACAMLKFFFPDSEFLGGTYPAIDVTRAFTFEVVITFILMIVIINVSTGSKEIGTMAGIAVGATVLLAALFGGPVTGASMNPARSLGPALVSGHLEHIWIYLTAPVVGAVLSIGCWRLMKLGKNTIGPD